MDTGTPFFNTGAIEQRIATINRPHDVIITALDYGYRVKVGCKEFAMSSKEDLISKLAMYLRDPGATQKKYELGELFNIAL